MMIVDVWHLREDFQKMTEDPEFREDLQSARYPSQPQLVEVYEAHATSP